jgi:hypothetical protein
MLKTVGNPSTRYGDQTIINGNFVIGTSGKGIDFSADGQSGGMTSELLDDYEEGTWTPTDVSGAGLTFASASGKYTKVGRTVTLMAWVTFPANASAAWVAIGGLPFSAVSTDDGIGLTAYNSAGFQIFFRVNAPNNMTGVKNDNSPATNANLSGALFGLQYTMFV